MDDIYSRLCHDLQISREVLERHSEFFDEIIKPKIKTKFLSHLTTTIEDLINEKRMKDIMGSIKEKKDGIEHIKSLYASKNVRFYSIVLTPICIRRRATTRYHRFGAIVYYNTCFEDKQIRILIAHELGHIINKELLNTDNTEETANLFAYIAMQDKNVFYANKCKEYIFKNDIAILNEILNVCIPQRERNL
jgi:Zn-dependent peptidase ImmA (M78 family)